MTRPRGALLLLTAALTQIIDASNSSCLGLYSNISRRLGVLGIDGSSSNNDKVTPFEHQTDQEDVQPSTFNSSFPNISIIVITVGFVIILGLVYVLVVVRISRNSVDLSDCDANQPLENSRFCIKRTTFTVPEVSHNRLDEIDSRGSVVPVLGGNTTKCKILEGSQQEMKPLWAEASAATSSYSVTPLSNRQSRLATHAPPQGRGSNDSQAASDNSSHSDDHSIYILESPVSTKHSLSSESDDVFPSTSWEDVDSYRSMDCTSTSSDVFGSNRHRKSGAWKQVYGPGDASPIYSRQSSLSSGGFFVRNVDPAAMERMRLDTRAYGARANNQMRLDVEV